MHPFVLLVVWRRMLVYVFVAVLHALLLNTPLLLVLCCCLHPPNAGLQYVPARAAAAAASFLLDATASHPLGFLYRLAEETEGFSDNNAFVLPLHR
jgi:hypothetical protein